MVEMVMEEMEMEVGEVEVELEMTVEGLEVEVVWERVESRAFPPQQLPSS